MTHERDIERLLDHWFTDGPDEAPDRVVDAVADRIGRQSQRPAWRLDRRPFQMSSMLKFATAVAAVGIFAILGLGLFRVASDRAGSSAAPTFEVVATYDAASLGLDRPVALAIGPNGDAYVTESNDRVSEITPDGVVVRRWGTTGSQPGQFDFNSTNADDGAYASIAVGPDGKVYVSDSDNHRVQVFTSDGTFVREFGTDGTGPGQFRLPFDLSVDPAGNVYVLDDSLMRLTKFDPDGNVVWTASGATDPELAGHGHDANIDSKGRIVLGNDDSGRVVYLDPEGKVVEAFLPTAGGACNVTLDDKDDLYVGGCGGDRIDVYRPSQALIGSWANSSLRATPEFGPNGEVLALERDGAIVKLKISVPAG